MNFIKRFITAWKRAASPYDELADTPDFWTKEDYVWLAQTLNHPSGQKWLRRLNNTVFRSAIDATKRTINPRYHCGVARGMAQLKSAIDSDYAIGFTLASAQSGNSELAEAEREAAELESLLAQL